MATPRTLPALTVRQRAALKTLIAYERKHGKSITIHELSEAMGCRAPHGARVHLLALAKKGRIQVSRYSHRKIRVLDDE